MIRKIQTEEEKERIQKRNRTIISIVLAFIMLFSTAGYFAFDFADKTSVKEITYNNIKFKQTTYGTWSFTQSGYNFETRFLPQDLTNISISTTKLLSDYNSKVLYFSGESISDLSTSAMQELTTLMSPFIQRANYACLSDNCTQNYAIKNCSVDNIIIFKRSLTNTSRISEQEKCLTLEYNYNLAGEEEKVADAFFYKLIGV
jgi:hypothetical protein